MYRPALTPRAHQREALRRVREERQPGEDVYAWFMDMGTGKTKVMLDEYGERVDAGELWDMLVVAPAGCYRNWDLDRSPEEPSEITKHMDPALRERLLVMPWTSGGGQTWRNRMGNFLDCHDRPRILVMNVEALSSATCGAYEAAQRFLADSRGALMAIDESPAIRNHKAIRTKSIIQLGRLAAARRIATGLPTPRSPMDLFSQFEFLDWHILGFRSFFAFQARYAVMRRMVMGGRSFRVEVGYRNVEELSEAIAPYSYRVRKDECLDLEPKVYTSRDVELTDDQRRIYKELRAYATSEIVAGSHVTATSIITQIMRLHQLLCGHVTDEEGNIHEVPERRTAVLLDVLQEHAGKAIIWVPWDHTIRRLAATLRKEYGERSVAMFWGGNRATRSADELRFKTDPDCRFMLSTQGAGGRGNTWTVADLVVYYANDYDLEHRDQSEDRAHRDGQTRSVTYVDLIARGTVDERQIKALRSKINLASVVTRDNFREWLI